MLERQRLRGVHKFGPLRDTREVAPNHFVKPPANDINKFAIIMTDGQFNTAYAGVNGGNVRGGQKNKSSNYAVTLCERMKNDDIEVFTIGFKLKEKQAKETMAACASPERDGIQFHYQVSTGTELKKAYRTIAQMIQTLRLVQ